MKHAMKSGAIAAAAVLSMTAAGCGSSSKNSTGGGAESLEGRTIGVLVTSLQSESEARFANYTKEAAAVLGWETTIIDGLGNPQQWAKGTQQLVTQKVDAIITIGIDAPAITQGLQAADAAGIPVIATNVSVAPTGKELFDAVYADDDEAMGMALADYALEKSAGAKAVGQTATVVYAADLLVQGAKKQFAKKGGSMEDIQDIDATNLAPSFAKTAVSLTQGHPDAEYLISCCDFAPAIDLPALEQAGKSDVTLMTRYDNASSLRFMADGAKLVLVVTNSERTILQAVESLAAYFADDVEIPVTYPGDDFELTVIDKSSMPAEGERVYDTPGMLSDFGSAMKSKYGLDD